MASTLSEYARRKQKMHEYLGNSCSICGSIEKLHIDHIDPEEKSFDVSANWSISWTKLQVELEKCQLLCFAHHVEKSKQEGSLARGRKHGSASNFAKLTETQVLEIRAKYTPYRYSHARLAKEYKVSQSTIKNIIKRRSWKS